MAYEAALAFVNSNKQQALGIYKVVMDAMADKKLTPWEYANLTMMATAFVMQVVGGVKMMDAQTKADVLHVLVYGKLVLDE